MCFGQLACRIRKFRPDPGQLASRIRSSVLILDSLRAGSGRSTLILLASCQQTCMTYTIAMCTVKTPDDGQRNCPKHVEFYSKNTFEKLFHLVGVTTSRKYRKFTILIRASSYC